MAKSEFPRMLLIFYLRNRSGKTGGGCWILMSSEQRIRKIVLEASLMFMFSANYVKVRGSGAVAGKAKASVMLLYLFIYLFTFLRLLSCSSCVRSIDCSSIRCKSVRTNESCTHSQENRAVGLFPSPFFPSSFVCCVAEPCPSHPILSIMPYESCNDRTNLPSFMTCGSRYSSAALIKQDVGTGRPPRVGDPLVKKAQRGSAVSATASFVSFPSEVVRTGRTVSSSSASIATCNWGRPSDEAAAPAASGISGWTVTPLLGWRETSHADYQGEREYVSSSFCSNSSHASLSRLSYLFMYLCIHVFIFFPDGAYSWLKADAWRMRLFSREPFQSNVPVVWKHFLKGLLLL